VLISGCFNTGIHRIIEDPFLLNPSHHTNFCSGRWHDFCFFLRSELSKLKTTMHRLSFSVLMVLLLFSASFCAMAEGTKEIMRNPAFNGRILFDSEFGDFGQFNTNSADRLHIRIKEPGEKIYYGFGTSISSDGWNQETANDVAYRIVDPSGQVVVSTVLQPLNGPGFINSYLEAISGPDLFDPQGYSPLELTCFKTGDYYIEFIYEDAFIGGRREFDYFDITVADINNKPVPGRIWSKAWMFTVSEKGGSPYDNPFYGKVYILSDDGVVTSVDLNGMRPFVFTLSANSTGVKNTGNAVEDRKSVPGKSTYPQYKVFLNDPDSLVFPSGSLGEFASPSTITGSQPPYCINVNTTKPGAVQVLIDLNGVAGYQVNSEDIQLVQNVSAGETCIEWDGKDGRGQMVDKCGGQVKCYVTYAGGLTHMPIYDVETNSNGFIVDLVRPQASTYSLALYWDDSNLQGASVPPSGGCDGLTGCHKFPYFFGDSATVNTWWYAISEVEDTIEFFTQGVALNNVMVKDQSCEYKQDGSIEVMASTGNPPIQYSIVSNLFQDAPLFEDLSAGSYTVRVRDKENCVKTRNVNLGVSTIISADFDILQAGAYNELEFQYTGEGGYNFDWDFGDGETSDEENPFHRYDIDTNYSVKLFTESEAPDNCRDSITKLIEVYPPLQVFVPNAFTPNGDNLNDRFEVYGIGMYAYEIYIFSSTGAQVFYSNNIEDSWDGRGSAAFMDHGVYGYVIRVRDRAGKVHEKKGTVTLLR
jgi:gliding motility-associated-like protein